MKKKLLFLFLKNKPQYSLLLKTVHQQPFSELRSWSYDQVLDFLKKYFQNIYQDYLAAEMTLNAEFRDILDDLRSLQEQGISITCLGDPDYPQRFYHLHDPPWILYVMGDVRACETDLLAVVGSREPTQASLLWLEEALHPVIKQFAKGIVSGGARGVDQKAHTLALRSGVPTVVVVPSGLLNLYPSNLLEWTGAIVQAGGCLISEYEPSLAMHKYLFHQRNRLIAALGQRVIVVEGKKKSGTLLTAKIASDLGREIGVVPGHPLENAYSGNLELLADGAYPFTSHFHLSQFVKECVETKNANCT